MILLGPRPSAGLVSFVLRVGVSAVVCVRGVGSLVGRYFGVALVGSGGGLGDGGDDGGYEGAYAFQGGVVVAVVRPPLMKYWNSRTWLSG